MIAKNTNETSTLSQVIETRPSTSFPASKQVNKSAGAIRRVMPKKRDREVPYRMKGGEH